MAASLADKSGYYVGGKTGTLKAIDKKIDKYFNIFPTKKPKYTLFVMLENPKINRDLIYNYLGTKLKPLQHVCWNLFMSQANNGKLNNFSHK